MTLGGLHGHGTVHSSGVGAPMVPRGQVIHHQQRCRAQQQVTTTITPLSRSGEFHLRVLREEEESVTTEVIGVLYTGTSTQEMSVVL